MCRVHSNFLLVRSCHRLSVLLLLAATWPMLCAWPPSSPAAETVKTPGMDLLPTPKQVQTHPGRLALGGRAVGQGSCCSIVAGPEAGFAAAVLAEKLHAPVVPAARPGAPAVTLRLDADAPFARRLSRDARPEAYRLEVSAQAVEIVATEPEGLLRGAATLVQLLQVDGGVAYVPQLTLIDWPNFRYRCASDWLLNVEANRWSYDWGDGRRACLARIKRKLDLCFAYKINQVWFDGFGWDLARCPGYADLMRECAQYARQRGIKLTFAGYGGGYGTSYQQSEIYRCGYFGQTFVNRRPYPDGKEYFCRGMDRIERSRRFGTCLSNEALARAKIDEMKRFVAAVEPGFMYIHDIDTGTYAESQSSWLLRCDECRKQWPGDALTDARGQAGALAAWYRQIRSALDGVSTPSGYRAARDLTLVFTSPLYTCYYEKGPTDLWQRETDYFCLLSRLMGPAGNVEFGLREQFYAPGGAKKIARLRAAMDKSGGQSGIHVIAFGGGDNYLSDDLANVSGLVSHFYDGAESVCLSNGGVHEEPVQLLNAELLWAGSAAGYREEPADEPAAQAVFHRMGQGKHRPAAIFGSGKIFHRICQRLWGDAAGTEMYRAYAAPGESGDGPLSRVWWAVTADMARLHAKSLPAQFDWKERHARWVHRKTVTDEALSHARRAAALTQDEDVHWFASCLALGSRFSECMALAIQMRLDNDAATRMRLANAISALESQITALGRKERTDALGGDPGCWRETLAELRSLVPALPQAAVSPAAQPSAETTWEQISPFFSPPPAFAGDCGPFRSPLKFYDDRPVKTAADWQRRRQEILARWHNMMGPWPPVIEKPKVEILQTERRENFVQHQIRFEWLPHEMTDGYLLVPDGEGIRPAVLVVYYEPETAIGLGKELRDFAYQLTKRGFVTLSMGNRAGLDNKTYAVYYPSKEKAAIQPLSALAYAAANAYHVLAGRKEVDPRRIGVMGHSFGGKWAMFASCLYDKFACAVWSDPGIVFDEARESVNYWEPWYLGYEQGPWRKRGSITEANPRTGLYKRLVAEGYDLHELHALMAPRPFLVSGGSEDSPKRWQALNHAIKVNELLGCRNRVAMTNRPEHSPNVESNEQIYRFFAHFLQQGGDRKTGTLVAPANNLAGKVYLNEREYWDKVYACWMGKGMAVPKDVPKRPGAYCPRKFGEGFCLLEAYQRGLSRRVLP